MVDFKPANHLRKNGGEWDMQKLGKILRRFFRRSYRKTNVLENEGFTQIAGAFHKSHSVARLTAVWQRMAKGHE